MDLPVSSGNKEGLRARIEGVERFEAADEGLVGTRGMVSESDVECIQSPTWRGCSWEASVDADSGRHFPLSLLPGHVLFFHNLGVFVVNRLPHHKTRPLEATTRLVPSLITRHSPPSCPFNPSPRVLSRTQLGIALLSHDVIYNLRTGMPCMFGYAPRPHSSPVW
jgi:hypothetical protein